MSFTHLHTHSHYSLLDGLAKIDELIANAKRLGMDSLALTDHGNLYGAIEFYEKATKAGLKPILGVEAYLAPKTRFDKEPGQKYFHQLLIVENETGWKNLIKLVTRSNLEGFYYKPRIDKELLREYSKGLIATSSCLSGTIPRLILADRLEEAEKEIHEFKEIFGTDNFFLELEHHPGIPQLARVNAALIDLAAKTGTPLVAAHDIHYALAEDADYHDILLAVQTGNKLEDTDRLSLKADDFSMASPERMAEYFAATPEAITNTRRIADRCNLKFELGRVLLPKFPLPSGFEHNYDYLEYLVKEKLPNRYPHPTPEVTARVAYELSVIKETGYAGYFLIVQDFINWAKDRHIAVGPGRGSAAGSIVSYILNITDIDPLAYDLLFERFLNPERIAMPDIDIDFADTRRDEVLNYVREKYGADHVAQIITFGTMAARAAVRDAGRALGISYGYCDRIAKLIPFNAELKKALSTVSELKQLYDTEPEAKKVIDAASHLEGVARHASVHACGTVIAPRPLTEYLPLQYAPQSNDTIITQFEGNTVEKLGLLKMDFLGLKNLTIIEETQKLIHDFKGEDVDVATVPLNDPAAFAILQQGDSTGVFQFESSGMRRYLRDLKPTELEDLIAMVSLYRPGPMELIPSYIRRKHGEEEVSYLHPKLEPILKNTYGVGVYQEQMMRIARDLAGFSLSEADILRKAIGKKIGSLLEEQKTKLIDGMIKNGIAEKTAKAIWELFPPFARYGFNRSHAACYALTAYRTAYLRAHYPVEFNTSLLNADLNDLSRLSFLVSECRKSNISVFPPDVNQSAVRFAPEGNNIRFGLLAIKNVGSGIAEAIVSARARGGPFASLADLIERVEHKDLNKKSMESLLKAGALESFGIERGVGLANLDAIIRFAGSRRQARGSGRQSLFIGAPAENSLRLESAPPAAPKQKLIWEKELLGFYVSEHPLEQHREKLNRWNVKAIHQALEWKNESVSIRLAGTITAIKRHVTKKGEPMLFVTIEDGDPIEMLVFSDTIKNKTELWQENNVIVVEGNMSWRDHEPKFICRRAAAL